MHEDNVNENNVQNASANVSADNTAEKAERMFTQTEVNQMMKAEKEKGRRSILKELGVEEVKNAKESLQLYQQYVDSQKTELQKATEALTEANGKIKKAEARAQKAEISLQAIGKFNADPESVEDLISIAIAKVSDEKDIVVVLKEMKENKAYSGFFNDVKTEDKQKKQGTGNPVSSAGKVLNDSENYGAMLAKRIIQKNQHK